MPSLFERHIDLSVIVPVYNLEKYLQPLLDSLKRQDVGEYEVEYVFVLNNCTDMSAGVILNSGIPCTIMNCPIQGCGPARNMGIESTTGEYIWFMDGDDWLLSDTAIRDALDMAKADNLDILRIPYQSDKFRILYFSMVWQYLLRREFVEEFRFPHIQPCEDDVYMENVLAKAHSNKYTFMRLPSLDKPLYFYNYMREGSNMYRFMVLHENIGGPPYPTKDA